MIFCHDRMPWKSLLKEFMGIFAWHLTICSIWVSPNLWSNMMIYECDLIAAQRMKIFLLLLLLTSIFLSILYRHIKESPWCYFLSFSLIFWIATCFLDLSAKVYLISDWKDESLLLSFVFIILKCVDLLVRFHFLCTVLSHERRTWILTGYFFQGRKVCSCTS